jgi:SAM-dependent methyltransferase
MTNYARMYRFGITPWERYATAAAASIVALLDREETGRTRPLGRALDLGCGRGLYTPELARRGWEAVGIDHVPAAIEAAQAKSPGAARLSYLVGDVTQLPSAGLGTFDFFLDIGCFQGLDAGQRQSQGEGVSALASSGATVLLLSFGPSRWRWLVEGASQEEVQTAFAGWEMLTAEPADTAGLGWPMNKTAPRWYRLRRQTQNDAVLSRTVRPAPDDPSVRALVPGVSNSSARRSIYEVEYSLHALSILPMIAVEHFASSW